MRIKIESQIKIFTNKKDKAHLQTQAHVIGDKGNQKLLLQARRLERLKKQE